MKKKIEVEIFSDQGNNAVLKLPGRKYPGILIQGDSFGVICKSADSILDLSRAGDKGLLDEIEMFAMNLREIYQNYLDVLKESGEDF